MKQKYHSVKLVQDKCIGCTDCIKRCPTEAIRVRNGKATIKDGVCIDCGMCIRVCRNHAKQATTSDLDTLNNYKFKIALPAPTLYGQYKNINDVNIILTALKKLGFDDVFEVSKAAEIITVKTKEFLDKNKSIPRPVISSACPVIIRLISMRFPSLIDNILPIISPLEAAAEIVKKYYIKNGVAENDLGIFFISPCSAKATYVINPLGVEKSCINGVISLRDIYLDLRNAISLVEKPEILVQSTYKGMDWALSGGESKNLEIENAIAVDGLENVISILNSIEDDQLNDVDFVEALACTGGCIGGPLTIVNGFVAKNNIKKLEKFTRIIPDKLKRKTFIEGNQIDYYFNKEIQSVENMSLDSDRSKALQKFNDIEILYNDLPQIDCGACGAPTCRAFSEDCIVDSANVEDCVFMLRRKVNELAEMMLNLSAKLPQTIGNSKRKEE